MKQLIFGFVPQGAIEDGDSCFAISYKEDFERDGYMNDTYEDECYPMFNGWGEIQINELMESIFEYPENAADLVQVYLETFNLQRHAEFEDYLSTDIWG